MSWMQEIKEGFPELPKGELIPSISQIDCDGLSQFVSSMPVQSLGSVGVYKDGGPIPSNDKTCRDANVPKVSRLAGLVPTAVAVPPLPAPLTELEIATLVATCLQRYSQTMV
jgi:hypothetical protein